MLLTNSKRSCDNSFVYQAPKRWNILPNDITALTDYKLFLSALLKFILPVLLNNFLHINSYNSQ